MKIGLLLLCLCFLLPVSTEAAELTAPEVPDSAREWMPDTTDSFGEGIWELLERVLSALRPDVKEAVALGLSAVAGAMLISLVKTWEEGKNLVDLVGCLAIGGTLLLGTNSLISLGADTVEELSQYGKLLLPVMTAALAAQGGVTSSAALYAGTALFSTLLTSLISRVLLPMVYLYLALSVGKCAVGEDFLKAMADSIKSFAGWCLKILLTVFTTYMSITGVVSGTTDAAALKATKVTISTLVPVVGGIMSDASEAVLVGAGTLKNAAGVYGILAVLALFLAPFLKIGIHYLVLKLTASLCGIFGGKGISTLIADFSSAMGLLLAMTGAVCLLLLVSTVCFLKGVG